MASSWGKCPLCGDYGFLDDGFMRHRCKPEFECRMETDDADDWRTVRASDAEGAAERFASQHDADCGDYPIVYGRDDDFFVLVRTPGAETFEKWEVRGEMVPSYQASKVD